MTLKKKYDDTRASAIGFLVWLHANCGNRIEQTYGELADKFRQCTLGTVRNYILELREAGYITTERRGKCAQTFVIDEEKYFKLVGAK